MSYSALRETLLTTAAEGPAAIVVDLTDLRTSSRSLLSVFTAVWMQVVDWPGMPFTLVAPPDSGARRVLDGTAVSRFVPVYDSLPAAWAEVRSAPRPLRASRTFPRSLTSPASARQFTSQTLIGWKVPTRLEEPVLVASELVENAVRHASGSPRLWLEWRDRTLTVAVTDEQPGFAVSGESSGSGIHGLQMVNALARRWGSLRRRPGGKVVWAVLETTGQ